MQDISLLLAYDEWANARIFGVIGAMPHGEFVETTVSSFSSIQATLAHIVAVEWVWLCRWQGKSPAAAPAWAGNPTVESLRVELGRIEHDRAEYLKGLTDLDLANVIDYRNLRGEPGRQRLGDLIVHLVNHGTYHRGQLTTMIRQAGATPVSTDFLAFRIEVP